MAALLLSGCGPVVRSISKGVTRAGGKAAGKSAAKVVPVMRTVPRTTVRPLPILPAGQFADDPLRAVPGKTGLGETAGAASTAAAAEGAQESTATKLVQEVAEEIGQQAIQSGLGRLGDGDKDRRR